MIAVDERAEVRELARRVAEIAAGEANARIRKRWCDVNALRRPDRAPVWCRPVGAWEELLPWSALHCSDPWLRGIEWSFRQTLIKHDIGDDNPVDAFFPVNTVCTCDPPNVWGVTIGHHASNAKGGAWAYDPPLKTAADFDHLRLPQFTYHLAETERALAQADELLGDIMPVRLVCDTPLGATLGTAAADLRGLSQMMMDIVDEPELLHRLMAHLCDATLAAMRAAEATGLLTPNNTGPMTCSDDPPAPTDGRYTFKQLWMMANSQEFDQVSPGMWEEFCLQYQMPILEQCGWTAYGCCENLTHKLDGVLTIPNLRIVVCSAWTHLDTLLEKVSDQYVIMWRQKASDVVFADDTDTLRRDLEAGMRKLQGRPYQIVLRELQTLAGHPRRLHEWTQIAIETAEKYA